MDAQQAKYYKDKANYSVELEQKLEELALWIVTHEKRGFVFPDDNIKKCLQLYLDMNRTEQESSNG